MPLNEIREVNPIIADPIPNKPDIPVKIVIVDPTPSIPPPKAIKPIPSVESKPMEQVSEIKPEAFELIRSQPKLPDLPHVDPEPIDTVPPITNISVSVNEITPRDPPNKKPSILSRLFCCSCGGNISPKSIQPIQSKEPI